MERPPTMGLPSVVTEWHAALWPVACRVRMCTPIQSVLPPVLIVIHGEVRQLPLESLRIPEQHAIQILAPNGSDQPLDNRGRDRQKGDGLGLLDAKDFFENEKSAGVG